MKATLSLSTNWNSREVEDGRALVESARALGLDAIELGYALTHRQADGIRAAVAAHEIAITSVHAFCPVPMGATAGHPEIHTICATDARARSHAVKAVLESARFAAEVGACAVVLHAGRVPAATRPAKQLESRAEAEFAAASGAPRPGLLARLLGRRPPPSVRGDAPEGQGGVHHAATPGADMRRISNITYSPDFLRRREKLYYLRDRKVPRFLDALRASLDDLLPEFESLNLKLGLENLPTFDAIPTEPEMMQLLAEFDSSALGYWHDLGHGQVRANLGYIHHASVTRRLAPHIVGMHLHDVVPPAGDHVMPPLGKTDFRALAFLAELAVPAVFEPAPGTPAEQIRDAIAYMRDVWP